MASRINFPKTTTSAPTGTTGAQDLDYAKLDNSLATARLKALGDVFSTIGKGLDYLSVREESRAKIVKARADLEIAQTTLTETYAQVNLGHRALDKLDEAQARAAKVIDMLVDEAKQLDDFEKRRRVIAEANTALQALADIRKAK